MLFSETMSELKERKENKDLSLVDRANAIILAKVATTDDISELQQIKREMSLLLSQYAEMAWEMEYNYNLERETTYISLKDSKISKTENEASKRAKEKAERMYGKRRIYKEKQRGMQAKINSIDSFCIDFHTKMKYQDIASMSWVEW